VPETTGISSDKQRQEPLVRGYGLTHHSLRNPNPTARSTERGARGRHGLPNRRFQLRVRF